MKLECFDVVWGIVRFSNDYVSERNFVLFLVFCEFLFCLLYFNCVGKIENE